MPADSLSHDHCGQPGQKSNLASGLRCDAADPRRDVSTPIHPVSRDDAALVIGLALGHARKGRGGGAAIVPGAILDRLVALADQGEPACRMVHAWLERQTAGAGRPVHSSRAMTVTTPVATTPAETFAAAATVGEGH